MNMNGVNIAIKGSTTLILSWISLFAALFVCVSAFVLRKNSFQQSSSERHDELNNKSLVITSCVFWLSFCDFFMNIWIILCWTPYIVGRVQLYNDTLCIFLGIFGQFFLIGLICWYLIITLLLIILFIYKTDINKLWKIQKKSGYFVWLIALFCCIIPMFGRHSYNNFGYIKQTDYKSFECWISNESFLFCLYIPIIFAMILSIILFINATYQIYDGCKVCKICKYKQDKNRTDYIKIKRYSYITQKNNILIRRLLAFVFVFIIHWIFPLIHTLIRINNITPFWLTVAHYISIALYGLNNTIVWIYQNTEIQVFIIKNICCRQSYLYNQNENHLGGNVIDNRQTFDDDEDDYEQTLTSIEVPSSIQFTSNLL